MNMAKHEKIFLRFNLASFILFPVKGLQNVAYYSAGYDRSGFGVKCRQKSERVWIRFQKNPITTFWGNYIFSTYRFTFMPLDPATCLASTVYELVFVYVG